MTESFRYIPNYTVKDYEQWEGEWELWDGFPIAMSPSPSITHQRVARRLFSALNRAIGEDGENPDCHCEMFYEIDWRVNQRTVVRPDMMVVCEPIDTEWIERPPTLIAELLSPSTAEKDRVSKRALYASQGVKYFLIVDPDAKTVDALVLQGDAYAPMSAGEGTLSFDMHDECAVSLDVAALWA